MFGECLQWPDSEVVNNANQMTPFTINALYVGSIYFFLKGFPPVLTLSSKGLNNYIAQRFSIVSVQISTFNFTQYRRTSFNCIV